MVLTSCFILRCSLRYCAQLAPRSDAARRSRWQPPEAVHHRVSHPGARTHDWADAHSSLPPLTRLSPIVDRCSSGKACDMDVNEHGVLSIKVGKNIDDAFRVRFCFEYNDGSGPATVG